MHANIEALIHFRLTKQRAASGIVVGTLQGSRRTFVAYGRTAIGGGKEVAADTIFEVASLTKVFTALLLADAVVRGEATLTIRCRPMFLLGRSFRASTADR